MTTPMERRRGRRRRKKEEGGQGIQTWNKMNAEEMKVDD